MQLRGSQLETGTLVGGYRIDEPISRGGMGVVYRVTNVALNRIYALKVLAPELADDDQFRDRFKREMRIAASLHHPNVVGIHYAGDHEGLLFFVMDYVTGSDLREVLMKGGALEPNRAVDLLAQFASALDAAHERGLVHRDVKPANVLITVRDGEEHAYLTDFGVAKRSDTVTGLTAQGAVVGTVDYMSPEQISGGHTDARTDVYALGCVFFQMLIGKVPYERENSVAKLFAHVHEPPPQLEGPLANLYPTFGPVIEQAMAKEPQDRYLSAGDFARDAAAALRGTRYTGPRSIVATGEARPPVNAEPVAEEASLASSAERSTPEATIAPSGQPEPAGETELASTPSSAAVPPAAETELASTPSPATSPPAAETELASTPSPATSPPPPAPAWAPSPAAVTPTQPPAPAWAPSPAAVAPGAAGAGAADASSAGPPGRSTPDGGGMGAGPPSRKKYGWPAAALLLIAAGVVAVILTSGSGKSSGVPSGQGFGAAARPVPTNRVTGSGTAAIRLQGNVATVTLDTSGLLNGSAHAMHIHAGGKGVCPPASAARLHDGHLSISTTNGIKFYGPPEVALTDRGDISPKSIVDFPRYPSVGSIRYKRTLTVPAGVADAIRAGNAVIVVHGIDYNHNGIYDNILDRSELNNALPGEATAPALCGPLTTQAQAAVGRQQSPHTIYTASLRIYRPPASEPSDSLWLLCHLAGTAVPASASLTTADSTA